MKNICIGKLRMHHVCKCVVKLHDLILEKLGEVKLGEESLKLPSWPTREHGSGVQGLIPTGVLIYDGIEGGEGWVMFKTQGVRRSLVEKTHTFPCGCSWFPRERREKQEEQKMWNMVTNAGQKSSKLESTAISSLTDWH